MAAGNRADAAGRRPFNIPHADLAAPDIDHALTVFDCAVAIIFIRIVGSPAAKPFRRLWRPAKASWILHLAAEFDACPLFDGGHNLERRPLHAQSAVADRHPDPPADLPKAKTFRQMDAAGNRGLPFFCQPVSLKWRFAGDFDGAFPFGVRAEIQTSFTDSRCGVVCHNDGRFQWTGKAGA